MKIGIISSVWYSIPPNGHGGREKMVADLALKLTEKGHEVIVYGIENKSISIPYFIKSPIYQRTQEEFLGTSRYSKIETRHLLSSYIDAIEQNVDVIHDNTGYLPSILTALAFANSYPIKVPILKTFHGIVDDGMIETFPLIENTEKFYINTISKNQSKALKINNNIGNVYNFLNIDEYANDYKKSKDKYFVILNRIVNGKGVYEAIQVAKKANIKLKIAGILENSKEGMNYFNTYIKPNLSENIEYIGEVNHAEKVKLLSEATGYIFPLKWEEPFGLSVIESILCGTPVVTFSKGAMPEIIDNGVNGYIVENLSEMAKAVNEIASIDIDMCKKTVIEKFSSDKLVDEYIKMYKSIL